MSRKVMLIDDDLDEHELFKHQLRSYNRNINVISAYNGKQALALLENIFPDWIFLDMNMPGMNGFEVLAVLKANEHLKNIPVYIYSTSDGYKSREPAIKLGAENYFRKAITTDAAHQMFQDVFIDN